MYLLLLSIFVLSFSTRASGQQGKKCPRHPVAFPSLTDCSTGSAFCTKYLGRDGTTRTIQKTKTVTTTPSAATVTLTTTKGFTTSTSFTTTVVPAPATRYTSTVSRTVVKRKFTTEYTSTSTNTITTTTTQGDFNPRATCDPNTNNKRGILPDLRPSCGLKLFSSQFISGGCHCLIDRKTTSTTTATKRARRRTIRVISTVAKTKTVKGKTTVSNTVTVETDSTTVVKTTTTSTVQDSTTTTEDGPTVTVAPYTFKIGVTSTDGTACSLDGRVVNFNPPYFLLQRPGGNFPFPDETYRLDCDGHLYTEGDSNYVIFTRPQDNGGNNYLVVGGSNGVPDDADLLNCTVDTTTADNPLTCVNTAGQPLQFYGCCFQVRAQPADLPITDCGDTPPTLVSFTAVPA